MATQPNQNIWIRLADAQPIALQINRDDEPLYREAEKLVNKLWQHWMPRFGETGGTSHDVLARVAFQFARLYMGAYQKNLAVNDALADFERQLDELVMGL